MKVIDENTKLLVRPGDKIVHPILPAEDGIFVGTCSLHDGKHVVVQRGRAAPFEYRPDVWGLKIVDE